ncbi:MAG: GNAT family N-acetyltransferase [Pseudomonadota bacterium]
MLEAVEITRANLRDYLDLALAPGQEKLVAPNAVTVAQAHYEPGSWVRGLAAGGTPVGMMAMIDVSALGEPAEPGDPENWAYLWRLMIDAKHQRMGYGTEAIEIAFAQARAWRRPTLALHVEVDGPNARAFYERLGFVATGRIDRNERFMTAPVPSC